MFLHAGLLILLLSCLSPGQSASGELYGIVAESGRAIANTRVNLSRNKTPKTVTETETDAQGRFCFLGLTPGSYSIELVVDHQQPIQFGSVDIRSDSAIHVSVTLWGQTNGPTRARIQSVDEGVGFGTDRHACSVCGSGRVLD